MRARGVLWCGGVLWDKGEGGRMERSPAPTSNLFLMRSVTWLRRGSKRHPDGCLQSPCLHGGEGGDRIGGGPAGCAALEPRSLAIGVCAGRDSPAPPCSSTHPPPPLAGGPW